jgi:fructose-1,6-bisphosphatase/inositol monophosphatase family enzyme
MSYESELAFAKNLALEAGKMMRRAFRLNMEMTWKADHTPVTDADLAINKMVISKIRQAYPTDGVLGEELSFEPNRKRLWVIDPIDGTYPFTLGAPLSTFCIALAVDDVAVIGIVLDPFLKRMFWANRGSGAFINDDPIHVSNVNKISDNYITLSSRLTANGKKTGVIFDQVEDAGGKAFIFRSFAYSCCLVAAGTAVATLIGMPKPWDIAAAALILEEAGGKVTDNLGQASSYKSAKVLIGSNGLVHDRMLELVNS